MRNFKINFSINTYSSYVKFGMGYFFGRGVGG